VVILSLKRSHFAPPHPQTAIALPTSQKRSHPHIPTSSKSDPQTAILKQRSHPHTPNQRTDKSVLRYRTPTPQNSDSYGALRYRTPTFPKAIASHTSPNSDSYGALRYRTPTPQKRSHFPTFLNKCGLK
jgi:hypothetical protein